jgi:hypothetical protein
VCVCVCMCVNAVKHTSLCVCMCMPIVTCCLCATSAGGREGLDEPLRLSKAVMKLEEGEDLKEACWACCCCSRSAGEERDSEWRDCRPFGAP